MPRDEPNVLLSRTYCETFARGGSIAEGRNRMTTTGMTRAHDGERRALQCAVALACLVPISAGAYGLLAGPGHFRYLSGLLLGLGLAFLTAVPDIETRGSRIALLTAMVVLGGLGRLASVVALGGGSRSTYFALAMELLVTPAIALWQRRIARI
jgi:hypothetical protein